ncbi:MAG: MFS transporter [Anaerolineae bacterium]|nr:MFS transporter [Anaerolineae bacterium]
MLKDIHRNNRLFMLANFLFALSYGLWMNLRQLHLGALGATPVEIGTVLGIVSLAGGILPLPAGLLTDRIGPKPVILGAWGIAAVGALIAALATDWSMAGVGFAVFMLVIAANPATVSYVLLNTSDTEGKGQAERVMATVFASWPAAMVFAPTLGGLIADRWGIAADLWLGAAGLVLSLVVFSLAADVRPTRTEARAGVRGLFANRRFVILALAYPVVLLTLELGYILAPTFLQNVRGYSTGMIGFLFSILSVGSLAFNYVVGKARPQVSFFVLVGAVFAGTILLWWTDNLLVVGIAFALWGAISTMWLLAQTSFGRLVNPQERGVALGLTETAGFCAIAVASWLSGQLYAGTPTHDLPLIVGIVAILAALILWLPVGHFVYGQSVQIAPPEQEPQMRVS